MDLSAILALLGGLGGLTGLAALYQARTAAKRADVETLCAAMTQLQDENKRQGERIERMQARIEELESENAKKDKQLSGMRVELTEWKTKYAELEYNYKILVRDAKELQSLWPVAKRRGDAE